MSHLNGNLWAALIGVSLKVVSELSFGYTVARKVSANLANMPASMALVIENVAS